MKFIPAQKEHFSDIARLAKSPEELFSFCVDGKFPWDAEQIEKIAQLRKNLTICEINGRVVAFGNLYDVIPGKQAFIGNLIVDRDFQGQGIGKRLVNHMIQICSDSHDAVAHLSVFNFNIQALLMYSRMGFEPYGVKPLQSPAGEPVALIHMRLNK